MNTEERLVKIPKFKDMIVFEDNRLIVINKPPFLSSLDERSGKELSVLKLARQYFADAQICHRLDRETSGLLLIAKNPETYRAVSIEFEHRRVKKVYHAIVDGTHVFDAFKVDLPILNQGSKKVVIDRAQGKRAETYFQSLIYFKHYTLIECQPITGRMHQIRIHLATQYASIVADTLYKGKPPYLSKIKRDYTIGKDKEEQPIMKRFALHAKELAITVEGEEYNFEAPYPKDFATFLKQLKKYDS